MWGFDAAHADEQKLLKGDKLQGEPKNSEVAPSGVEHQVGAARFWRVPSDVESPVS